MLEMPGMSDEAAVAEEEAVMEAADEMPGGMMDAGEQEVMETGRIAEVHGDIVLEDMPGSDM